MKSTRTDAPLVITPTVEALVVVDLIVLPSSWHKVSTAIGEMLVAVDRPGLAFGLLKLR